jgi:hypothetical protein
MKTQFLAAAALLASELMGSPAVAHYAADHAVWSCVSINPYQPAIVLEVEYDPEYDDYFVWLEDVDGDVWRCIADGYGDVYENDMTYWA